MLKSKINVGVYGLAVLPVDYLSRLGCPFEQLCKDQGIDPDYREVFSVSIRSYQLVTYLKLVREHYGRGVANQIRSYQQRLLEKEPGGIPINHTIRLINAALDSDAVVADTDLGCIDIPIEMNVALSLLLGVTSSPHCVNHPDQCATEIGSMGLDVDWLLSQCLTRARDDMQKVFAPLLACIDSGVRIDYVQSCLNDKLVTR
ncbi:MAG: hypothetical protein ABFS24_14010 [Pseudomonadota bacterium]